MNFFYKTSIQWTLAPSHQIGDYIINLHSGLKRIGSWPIISSLASWRRIPIVPCDSDAHIVGERKDITNLIAQTTSIMVPKTFQINDGETGRYVIKPRDLGMSVGLILSSDPNELVEATNNPHLVVQKFIPGYDATVAFVKSPSGSYTCIGGMIYCPKVADMENWVLLEDDKNENTKITDYARLHISVDSELSDEASKLISRIGSSSIYRVDFRLISNGLNTVPQSIKLDNSYFLEANPTPAISPTSSVGEMLQNTYESKSDAFQALTRGVTEQANICNPAALLLSNQLYASQKNNQR